MAFFCSNRSSTQILSLSSLRNRDSVFVFIIILQGGGGVGGSMRVPNTDSCVEVGAADLEDGVNGLQVRRGSEPTLHQDTLPPQRQVRLNEYVNLCVLKKDTRNKVLAKNNTQFTESFYSVL